VLPAIFLCSLINPKPQTLHRTPQTLYPKQGEEGILTIPPHLGYTSTRVEPRPGSCVRGPCRQRRQAPGSRGACAAVTPVNTCAAVTPVNTACADVTPVNTNHNQSTPISDPTATKLASLCLDPKCYELLNATKLASLCLDPKCYETCVLVPGTRERRQLLGRAMGDSNMAEGNQLPVLVMQLKVLPPCVVCLPVSPSVVCVSLCRLCQCLPVSCVSVSPSVVCVSPSVSLRLDLSPTGRWRAMLSGRGRACCHAVMREGARGSEETATNETNESDTGAPPRHQLLRVLPIPPRLMFAADRRSPGTSASLSPDELQVRASERARSK
jgi:hypothetical protein